jgi:SPX domain protein involved in polyphosphate accumulation
MPFPTETREKRFLVPADRADAVRSWARARFRPDPHGGGLHHDTYDITSLYFDNAEFDVFHRRGSYGRAKYRVRRYGAAPFVFVERKLKTSDLVSKRRSAIAIGELPRLASPEPRKGWPGYWFHW